MKESQNGERRDTKSLSILQSLIEVSDIHAARLETACCHLLPIIPVTPERMAAFTDEQFGFSELLISRFGKLQDVIGSKIFPLLLEMSNQGRENLSFLDTLHRLEKLGLLPDAKEWIDMRELRNQLTHDYPNNPDLMADNLNKVFKAGKNLVRYWHGLKEKAEALRKKWAQELSGN